MKTELFNVFTEKQIRAIKDCIRQGYLGDADCLFNGDNHPIFTDGFCTGLIYKGKHFSNQQISGICSGISKGISKVISKHNINWISHNADYWGDDSGGMIFFHYERIGIMREELQKWANL